MQVDFTSDSTHLVQTSCRFPNLHKTLTLTFRKALFLYMKGIGYMSRIAFNNMNTFSCHKFMIDD